MLRDVTAIREKEEELTIRLGEINHDIRNGLTGLGYALARLRDFGLGNEVNDCLELADSCRADIADLAQSAGQPAPVEFAPAQVAGAYRLLGDQKTRVDVELTPDVPKLVRGPRRVISQVLGNLVGNARKQHVERVWIEVDARPAVAGFRNLYITVEDDGAGLPDDIRDRLELSNWALRRWYVGLAAGDSGRGLAHCQFALIKADSKLIVAPGRTRGPNGEYRYNRFTFVVQVEEVTASDLAAAPPDPRMLAGRGPVLVVDDDEPVRAGLAWKLLGWGIHPVVVCASGEEAVKAARAASTADRPFELVLMDIRLGGGIDGYEATRQIRLQAPGTVRILSISVSEQNEDRRKAAGFDAYLRKDRIRRPVDLARAWGLPLVAHLPPPPPPPPVVTGPAGWFACFKRRDAKIEFLEGFALIAALTRQGTILARFIDGAVHEWKKTHMGQADEFFAAADAARTSADPVAAIDDLLAAAIRQVWHPNL